jgi:hypothetical protein
MVPMQQLIGLRSTYEKRPVLPGGHFVMIEGEHLSSYLRPNKSMHANCSAAFFRNWLCLRWYSQQKITLTTGWENHHTK